MIVPVLSVQDIDASIAFYTDKLGFKHDMVMAGPDGTNVFGSISLGQAMFMLSKEGVSNPGQGVDFMVYLPDDMPIDDVYDAVKNRAVPIESEIKTEYWGDRVFSVIDPDGFRITIAQTVEQTDMEHIAKVMRGEIPRS